MSLRHAAEGHTVEQDQYPLAPCMSPAKPLLKSYTHICVCVLLKGLQTTTACVKNASIPEILKEKNVLSLSVFY